MQREPGKLVSIGQLPGIAAMSFLSSLFTTSPACDCYALLDAQGICKAFKQSRQAPQECGWVQIQEIRVHWLNRPLPASARVTACATGSRQRPALAA